MSDFAVLSIALVSVLLVFTVVAQRRELRTLSRTVSDHLMAHISLADQDESDTWDWPPGLFEVGARFAGMEASDTTDRWRVISLVRPGCTSCDRLLEALPGVRSALPEGFEIMIATAAAHPVPEVSGIKTIGVDSMDGIPTPAFLLVAPDGTIQGKGRADSEYTVAHFVEEGLRHGYGPAGLLAARARDSGQTDKEPIHSHSHPHPH